MFTFVGFFHRVSTFLSVAVSGSSILWGGFFLVWMSGCQGVPWKNLRVVSRYAKKQDPEPYRVAIRATTGALIRLKACYATAELLCAFMEVNNEQGDYPIYINPAKARLVGWKPDLSGQIGTWAITGSMASREEMFRRMARSYHKLPSDQEIRGWSRFYFPSDTIAAGKTGFGMICFQLSRSPEDPEKMVVSKRSRIQLTDVLIGGGASTLDWLWLEPLGW